MTEVVRRNAPDLSGIDKREQPLSTACSSETGPRETWNERNPPHEAVIVANLTTAIVRFPEKGS